MCEEHEASTVSRRGFIKGSALALAGLLLTRWYRLRGGAIALSRSLTKRIYLAPDDHTDYFWSAGEAAYREAFLTMIDYYLDLADATQANPAEHQSRWNCDGSFWLWEYERHKPAADFQRLISRIRDGHISAPLNALVVCLGGAPAEAVLRGMFYAGQLERRHSLRFPMAISMENQVLPYGLGALWAGSGARYSWKGVCGCDSRVAFAELVDRDHDIYWWVGPDGSRILMKWNSLVNYYGIGGYAEARDPTAAVTYVDTDAGFAARYPYQVIGVFGQGGDDLQTTTDEFVTVAQNMTTASRQVIVSNQEDFFADFEAAHGATLPVVSATFGNEWDLYCAALAEVSAQVKRSVEKLRGAEALATLVSLQNPTFMDGRTAARDLAWMNLGLFWEHNFGMANPPTGSNGIAERIAWQRRLADEIRAYVDSLAQDAAAALGGLIEHNGTSQRFFVFNPLSWMRTDTADLVYGGSTPVHVVDLSAGQEMPSQLVTVDGQSYLRILARQVPPVGYKVFEIRTGAGQTFVPTAEVTGNMVEHPFYRLTIAERGAITSLIDRTRGDREFARIIDGRAINDLGPSPGTLTVEEIGPVSVTLKAVASAPLQHTTRITLIRDSRRIEIGNEIEENFERTQTWAFGFDLEEPDLWHEEVGAVIRAKLLAQGGHYSPRQARYDWLTINHFADLSSGSAGVTLSNADCCFMRAGRSSVAELDADTPQISVLAGGRVVEGNSGNFGLPDQGGDTRFRQRFALQTHGAYDGAAAMRFAVEHQNPLIAGILSDGSVYPSPHFSLLNVDSESVLLWALKPADDGIDQGVVLRLWNLAGSPATVGVDLLNGAIRGGQRVTHIETPIEAAQIEDGRLVEALAGHQLKTVLLQLGDPAVRPTATPTEQATAEASPTPPGGTPCPCDPRAYLPVLRQ